MQLCSPKAKELLLAAPSKELIWVNLLPKG